MKQCSPDTEAKKLDYDVIIIGGGMVGATLACLLGQKNISVALIERQLPEKFSKESNIDQRVFALSLASQNIFNNINAWGEMVEHRVSPFREMHVWDATGDGTIHFDCAEIGEPTLGHIVEGKVIVDALYHQLDTLKSVTKIIPSTVVSVESSKHRVNVVLDDEREISASLLVGSDGAQSKVREMSGLTTHGWPYDQKGVVAVVTTDKPHKETAWQRFLPTGPLAFLPLSDGRCSIVWSVKNSYCEELMSLSDEAFCERLTAASDKMLGVISGVGPRAAFPLKLQYAPSYLGDRIALIGDAAHVVHPLAGQGVNLGLLDAACLAQVLQQALTAGKDIGDKSILRRYERWRKGDNLTMMAAMDGFKRLFSNDLTPLVNLRNLGLSLADKSGPFKKIIIKHAVGLAGDLPLVAR